MSASSTQILPPFQNTTENMNYRRDRQYVGPNTSIMRPSDFDREAKIKAVKKLFHQDRYLLVKHLPRNVTKDEIAALFLDMPVKEINLNTSDDTSSTAAVMLENPEILDQWDDGKIFLLRGQSISVAPTGSDMLLCVAKLPLYYTEEDFYKLISPFGDIKMYFLMISESTGKSKGYGFVRYAKKEIALSARNCLNDKTIDTFRIVCDWLETGHVTFGSLHSKCLYVDNLPKNFKDMCEFRRIFSAVINPPYCQIALKNGCLLDWGLVEYRKSDDAELVQTTLDGFYYKGHEIRVLYYIPGVRAINLYLQLVTDTESQGKSAGLLPEPSGQSVMMSIQNLSKQNPIFAQNLRNIILNQIQESQTPKESVDDTKFKKVDKSLLYGKGNVFEMKNVIPSPIVVNSLSGHPMINAARGNFFPPPQNFSLLSNSAVAPPLIEPFAIPSLNQLPTLPMPNKPQCIPAQVYWNDVLNMMSQRGVPQFIHPQGFIVPSSAPMSPALVPDPGTNVPLNFHQNIMNILNPGLTSLTNLGQVHTAPIYPGMPIDTPVQFTGSSGSIIPHTMSQPIMSPVSYVNPKSFGPCSWAPVQTVMSPTYPTAMLTNSEWPPFVSASTVMSAPGTPIAEQVGLKRKILPSPETSPEGDYIGQHSQGIGGHYADSYFKKKKWQ